MDRQEYVCGFVLDQTSDWVLLIRKNRPAWQAGMLNGVGGKIEPDDPSPEAAMSREFSEEAGLYIAPSSWFRFCCLHGADGVVGTWKVHFFCVRLDLVGVDQIRQMEDEELAWYPRDALPGNVIDNLRWLIPMAFAESKVEATAIDYSEYQ